jgi:hypothetical protein
VSLTEALNEAAAPNKIAVLFVHGEGRPKRCAGRLRKVL